MMPKREEKQKDDDEEALSLEDKNEVEDQTQVLEVQEEENKDFEFGSWRADSVLREPNMCAAEDVFFQGQILPLRLSVSTNCSGMAGIRLGSRCVSRSESMDHGYGSANSRNSSIESPYSIDSSSDKRCVSRSESMDHRYGSTSTTSRKRSIENPNLISSSSGNRWVSRSDSMDHTSGSANRRSGRIESHSSISSSSGSSLTTIRELEWNRFHAHPSPKPQIWQTAAWHEQGGNRSRRSTIWGFFRLGLVRMPEMELENLKRKLLDKSKSYESSSSSSRNSRSRNRLKVFEGFSGCKCSVSMVETIASRIATMKKAKGNAREENLDKVEKKQEKQGKQGMGHRRSFEWLKQLSLAVADLPRGPAASHRQ